MARLYSETSIFALPSRMEGFPMVLMEAMSQGCACVAFDVFGASSEMLDSDSGIVIPDGNYKLFEDALIKLINNEGMRENFSSHSLKNVSRFTVSNFADDWEQLISTTINNY